MLASMPARKLRSLRYTQRLLTMASMPRWPFLWKATSLTPSGLGLGDVGRAGIAAVARDLAWRLAVRRNVALQHGQKALGIGRIAGLDDDVEDQATATGRQIDLVTVLHLAAAFDDDVGVRF